MINKNTVRNRINNFIMCFLLVAKRFFFRKGFLLSFLCIPVMIYLLGGLVKTQEDTVMVVLYPGKDEIAQKVCADLEDEGEWIIYREVDSLSTLQQMVMAKKAECGVIFEDNLEEAFLNRDFNQQIKIVKTPTTVLHKMVREEVYTALLKEMNEALLLKFTDSITGMPQIETEKRIKEIYQKYKENGTVFGAEFQTVKPDIRGMEAPKILLSPVRGMTAVFIWAEILFAVLLLFEDQKNKISFCLQRERKILLQFHILFFPAIVSAMISLFLIEMSKRKNYIAAVPLQFEMENMFFYIILCILSALFVYALCRNKIAYVVLATGLLISGLVLSPVFFLPDIVFPQMQGLEYFMIPGAYLAAFYHPCGQMLKEIAFLAIADLLLFWIRNFHMKYRKGHEELAD